MNLDETMRDERSLEDVPTPALILDLDVVERNCAKMIDRAGALGVRLRPHMKTAKSVDIGRLATAGQSDGVTVSTISEAEYFAAAGFDDLTYAVGIVPQKIEPLAAIARQFSAQIRIITDSATMIQQVAERSTDLSQNFSVFIEIDCGGGRGGISPSSDDLLTIAAAIHRSKALTLAGVLTHAGQSYGAGSIAEIASIAEQEAAAVRLAAERLRAAGFEVPYVSVGSTPTAVCARKMEGVTDMRPGVYTLFDVDQLALGVCRHEDIAATVLATVIGHNPRSQYLLIDAGGLALSKDNSAQHFMPEVRYGLIADLQGRIVADLAVEQLHQEHGFVSSRDSYDAMTQRFPIGSKLRVLPVHVCMTAAAYERFTLVRGASDRVVGEWAKLRT